MRFFLVLLIQTVLVSHVTSQGEMIEADNEDPTTSVATTIDPTASTGSIGTTVSSSSDATEGSTVSGQTDGSTFTGETTVSQSSESTDSLNETTVVPGSSTPEGPHADCFLCVPTVQCGETIEGDYSSGEVNVLLMKPMEDGDYFIVKGEVFQNAKIIYFDIYKDLSVGKAQEGGEKQLPLLQFKHQYETNLTFSRSLANKQGEWDSSSSDSFREAVLPLPIREKKPWTLMFKMHQNQTGVETGDETGWFNNHIPWNGTATTQSFNIRGNWKTTSVTYKCLNSSMPIL